MKALKQVIICLGHLETTSYQDHKCKYNLKTESSNLRIDVRQRYILELGKEGMQIRVTINGHDTKY